MSPLYALLATKYPARPISGNVPITCPYCGTENKKGYKCGFSEKGFYCWVCRKGASLKVLAEKLGQETNGATAVALPIRKVKPPAPWLPHAPKFQKQFTTHPRRFEIIQAYKPMPIETIERFWIGVGCMPRFVGNDEQWLDFKFWQRGALRITIPLTRNGEIVGWSGRALSDFGPKWLNATGSERIVWGMDFVDGRPVIICENQFDAAWASGEYPEYAFIATNGTAINYENILACVRELKTKETPKLILMFDNDLPGQAKGELQKRLIKEWYIKNADVVAKNAAARPPETCVPAWVNACRREGLEVVEWDWRDMEAKADLGLILKLALPLP